MSQPPQNGKRKRIQYDRNKIKEAVDAVKTKTMKIREAARFYKIPRTTLQDRVHGRVDEDSLKVGRDTVLNEKEEQVLIEWLVQLAKCGFPRKKSDLINTVEKIIKDDGRANTFKNGRPGDKWYSLFMKRHPNLSERAPEAISQARAIVTEEFIRKWFQDLQSYLSETGNEDVLLDPHRIFNGDETSFSICPKSGKVIGPKGWKNVYEIAKGGEKETITVLLVFSASGESIPPMVVFPYVRRPPRDIVDSAPSTWFIGISESGWMRSGLFFEYIANCLNNWLIENNIKKPVLLFVDGHKSHLTKELSNFCEENGIILYALPPNTTHLMQPADVSVFRPLKHEWRKTVKDWQDNGENSNRSLTKVTFCPLLSQTLKKVSSETIKNGFRKCGLYPFEPNAVDYTKCVKNTYENFYEKQKDKEIDKITELEVATTIKVLKKCEAELKIANIELNTVEEIIRQKTDQLDKELSTKISAEAASDPLTILPLQTGTPLILETASNLQITEAASDFVIILPPQTERPSLILENNECYTSTSPDEHAQVLTVPAEIHLQCNDKVDLVKPKSSSPVSRAEVHVLAVQNNLNNNDENVPHSLRTYNCETSLDSCKLKDLPKDLSFLPISTSMMENVDIASDFDFSLPASPSTSFASTITSRPSSPAARNKIDTRNTVSPAFRKHLFAPKRLCLENKRRPKGEKMPLAISSPKWRQFMQEKDDEKEQILKKREERKMRIAKSKEEKARKKIEIAAQREIHKTRLAARKKKKPTIAAHIEERSSQNKENMKERILCAGCEDELISDVEEDDLKNIGCDSCPKWYHLKCTNQRGKRYDVVAAEDFTCHLCLLHLY